MQGLLGAIKGAAEYEFLVNNWARRDAMAKVLEQGGFEPAKAEETAAALASKPQQVSTWTATAEASTLTPESKTRLIEIATEPIPGEYLEGQRRMGPQLFAHLLMVFLIILGNVIFFAQRRRGGAG